MYMLADHATTVKAAVWSHDFAYHSVTTVIDPILPTEETEEEGEEEEEEDAGEKEEEEEEVRDRGYISLVAPQVSDIALTSVAARLPEANSLLTGCC